MIKHTHTSIRATSGWAKALVLLALTPFGTVTLADSVGDAATNPVGNLMSFRAQMQVSNYNNADGESVAGVFQSVLPFKTGWDAIPLYLNRTTVPYSVTPDLDTVGHIDGLGDTSMLNFFIPKRKFFGGTFAFGPALTIPTGGDNVYTSSGKWQIGPNLVYFNGNTPGIQWGLMTFSQFSFADTRPDNMPDAPSVSVINVQPIFTKHLKNGWYIAFPDLPQTYNFKTDRWALNLGPLVGRVFKWRDKQPLQIYGGVYYNTEDYGDISPEWTFKFNISFLIPKS
jgi:hypothetical protein